MINKDRIVAIQKMDLLSMLGTILNIANVSYTVLKSVDVEGDFTVTGSGAVGNVLADQPVQSLDFATGVTGATVYFVADYDFVGFKIAGTAVTPTGDVVTDGVTVQKAVLASGAVTVTAVTPVAE